jgi:hypothetical protein
LETGSRLAVDYFDGIEADHIQREPRDFPEDSPKSWSRSPSRTKLRGVVRSVENAALYFANQLTMLRCGALLYVRPFLVCHERGPSLGQGSFVGPFEEINELRPFLRPGLPHDQNIKVVTFHDAHRVISKPRVEGGLVVLEYLVDAQLMDHILSSGWGWIARLLGSCRGNPGSTE